MNPLVISTPIFNRLRFVLVETSRAGNIGATARAMKNMGFSDLVLVNPRMHDVLQQPEAVAFASGAQDVLSSARVCDSIEEALDGCHFAAAVSARLREFSPPVQSPREFATDVVTDLATRPELRAALVFGNERFGLPNQMVERCNVLINIPANPAYSSLNLAQAVQILSYECRLAASSDQPTQSVVGFRGDHADVAEIERMFAHLEQALIAIDFLDPEHPKKLMPRLRRLFARSGLETEEVSILRGVASHILRHQHN